MCIYIYIHQCMAVGRIWGSFSCPSKEGSGRRTHEGLPMHPLGGRELYIVSRGWSLDWLLGVCLPPRYFPRFFSIAFFFFLLFPLSTPTTSSHVDFSIPSYLRLFFRSWNSWELFREREKKRKKSFDFRSLSKGNFSPLSLRFHATPSSRLLSLTSPFFVPPFFLGMAPTRASSCCGWLLIWLTDLCISLLSYYASSSPYLHMQIEQAYLRPPPIHPLL